MRTKRRTFYRRWRCSRMHASRAPSQHGTVILKTARKRIDRPYQSEMRYGCRPQTVIHRRRNEQKHPSLSKSVQMHSVPGTTKNEKDRLGEMHLVLVLKRIRNHYCCLLTDDQRDDDASDGGGLLSISVITLMEPISIPGGYMEALGR